ncbi:MAG: hypothetical protein EOO05_09915 [Chitinophagaceae bacterium]|nr:MAG: hypothetical protein EOO05_09915 [Chitinophagaceae bacterium]
MEKQAVVQRREVAYGILLGLIASVWLINGLFCKVLMMVPRHQEIVAGITGRLDAPSLTRFIGIGETLVAIWIVSGVWRRTAAIFQVVLIILMNIIEIIFVPDLLLWGRWNFLFAILLAAVILYNEFVMRPDKTIIYPQSEAGK